MLHPLILLIFIEHTVVTHKTTSDSKAQVNRFYLISN